MYALDRDDAFDVVQLGVENPLGLLVDVHGGIRKPPDRVFRSYTMDIREQLFRVDSMSTCPGAPYPIDDGGGVQQRAVHVEEECGVGMISEDRHRVVAPRKRAGDFSPAPSSPSPFPRKWGISPFT